MNDEQKTLQETPTDAQPTPIFHFFLCSGEVEYQESKVNTARKYLKANVLYKGSGVGITAKDLGNIQTRLQMSFHQKYSRTHKEPPFKVTDCIITACSFLGTHTDAEFMAGAVGQAEPIKPDEIAPTEDPKPS